MFHAIDAFRQSNGKATAGLPLAADWSRPYFLKTSPKMNFLFQALFLTSKRANSTMRNLVIYWSGSRISLRRISTRAEAEITSGSSSRMEPSCASKQTRPTSGERGDLQTGQCYPGRICEENHEAHVELQLSGEHQPVHGRCSQARSQRRGNFPGCPLLILLQYSHSVSGSLRWSRPLQCDRYSAVAGSQSGEIARSGSPAANLERQDYEHVIILYNTKVIKWLRRCKKVTSM